MAYRFLQGIKAVYFVPCYAVAQYVDIIGLVGLVHIPNFDATEICLLGEASAEITSNNDAFCENSNTSLTFETNDTIPNELLCFVFTLHNGRSYIVGSNEVAPSVERSVSFNEPSGNALRHAFKVKYSGKPVEVIL